MKKRGLDKRLSDLGFFAEFVAEFEQQINLRDPQRILVSVSEMPCKKANAQREFIDFQISKFSSLLFIDFQLFVNCL